MAPTNRSGRKQHPEPPPFLDFFAGSGLVTEALKPLFRPVWANDNSSGKAAVYVANHSEVAFDPSDVANVKGESLPRAALWWASFPCQDLSLAGKLGGIDAARSGLVWHWLRVLDEVPENDRPPLLVAENVTGLLTASGGKHYRALHMALVKRGYRAGAMVLDAALWLPQSRPRVFVVAACKETDVSGFEDLGPNWTHRRTALGVVSNLPDFIWWKLPAPAIRTKVLDALLDFDTPCDAPETAAHNVGLIPPRHLSRLKEEARRGLRVAPGYKRTRPHGQVLELRFDGVAGCLRTPEGGSSRQHLVIPNHRRINTRLLTVREAARLMGAPNTYKIQGTQDAHSLPGTYNAGYAAMGDAVAVPVARHLAKHLLLPLALRAR